MTRRLLDRVVRRFDLPRDTEERAQRLLDTEWLVTNGLGGYSSSTLAGLITRRYHGVLVAALPNPIGRMVMLNHLGERLIVDGRATSLTNEERAGGRADHAVAAIVSDVRLEGGLPVWEYEWEGVRFEKRILMPYRQNSVHVTYRLVEGPANAVLELIPAVHFRGYEDRVDTPFNSPSTTRHSLDTSNDVHLLSVDGAVGPLRLKIIGGRSNHFEPNERVTSEFVYPVEQSRGYEFRGTLWTPGHYAIDLEPGGSATLIASVEPEDVMLALSPEDAAQCEQERRRRLVAAAVP
ncbi:MAG TPA: glycogen debranching enzyme N-terminal domain-containing protein, partial [Gemmatimonadaceae bacterium]